MNFNAVLAGGIARAQQRVENALGESLDFAVDEAEKVMKERVPVRTGRLKNSITRERDGTTQRIRVSAPYALVVEFGKKGTNPKGFWRPGVAVMRRMSRARRTWRRGSVS